jgi:RNA polymerase sigma-70 factor (ECF subfamily)
MSKNNPDESKEPGSVSRTSQSLLVAVKENDPDAWNRFVELYSPLVYFWCQESGLPATDLNDIFQEVFHALARNIEKYSPRPKGGERGGGSFRGWLRTLTRNKVNDHFRKGGREPKPQGGTAAFQYLQQLPAAENREPAEALNEALNSTGRASTTTSHSHESDLERRMLRKALDNIRCNFKEQTWQAFWMVVVDGRETNDVAADLAMRPGTVRVAKSRVLKRLRLEIGEFADFGRQ